MELLNSGTDSVVSSVDYNMMRAWHVENLTLSGSGNVSGTGNWLNNLMTGNAGNNVLDGNRGNDTLDGGAGSDTLKGGDGDDWMIWDAADGSFQGGAGTDRMLISGSGAFIDLTAISDLKIVDTEIIDLTGSGNNALKLGLADVLAISSSTDALRIDGNVGDTVSIAASGGWVTGIDQVIGLNTYRTYTQGTATLLVDADSTTLLLA
jgi:Ca2+-binding RTX toxin-like protein